MGVDAIVRLIEAEAAAEAERIIATARDQAAGLVDAAEASVVARVREAGERAEPTYRAEAMRLVNAARLRSLERRAAQAASLVDEVMAGAQQRLAAIVAERGDRWRSALDRLIAETVKLVGSDAEILVRGADVEIARPTVERLGCRIGEIEIDGPGDRDGLSAGVVGRSADDRIEVDATLAARLERARTNLSEPIARLLGVRA
ncbi:MAG: V-type ATP synthase subunit E family protein [Chloroflexota bacterium]